MSSIINHPGIAPAYILPSALSSLSVALFELQFGKTFEDQLLAQGIINDADIQNMEKRIKTEVNEAFDFAENSPFPDPGETFKGVYREQE